MHTPLARTIGATTAALLLGFSSISCFQSRPDRTSFIVSNRSPQTIQVEILDNGELLHQGQGPNGVEFIADPPGSCFGDLIRIANADTGELLGEIDRPACGGDYIVVGFGKAPRIDYVEQ